MDPLEAVFLFCFVFGLGMSAASFFLGALHPASSSHHEGVNIQGTHGAAHGPGNDIGHAPGHGAPAAGVSTHHADGLDADRSAGPSPFNVSSGTAFLAFFGGIGYLLYGTFGLAAGLALFMATGAGLAGGAVVFLFLARVLYRNQRFLDPNEFRMEGSIAHVSRTIRTDGIGEIIYSKDGTRRSEGARSATGEEIAEGSEVVIVKYEAGIAYVEPWTSYLEKA